MVLVRCSNRSVLNGVNGSFSEPLWSWLLTKSSGPEVFA